MNEDEKSSVRNCGDHSGGGVICSALEPLERPGMLRIWVCEKPRWLRAGQDDLPICLFFPVNWVTRSGWARRWGVSRGTETFGAQMDTSLSSNCDLQNFFRIMSEESPGSCAQMFALKTLKYFDTVCTVLLCVLFRALLISKKITTHTRRAHPRQSC